MVLIYGSWIYELPMQSVPIATNAVNSNLTHGEVYTIQHYVIKVCHLDVAGRWFFPDTLDSSTNKTDPHNN